MQWKKSYFLFNGDDFSSGRETAVQSVTTLMLSILAGAILGNISQGIEAFNPKLGELYVFGATIIGAPKGNHLFVT